MYRFIRIVGWYLTTWILYKNNMHTAQELRDLNYHPYCFEKNNVYKNNRAPEVVVGGGGSSRSGFGFIHSLGL